MARICGGLLAWIVLGALLRAAPAPVKSPPPIAPGTTVEAVLRTHGRPKGQMNAGARELWTYDRFRVVFENGRVVRVDPLERRDAGEGAAKSPAPPPAAGATRPVTFNITTESADAARPATPPAAAERVVRTPAQRAAASGRSTLSKIVLGVLFVALAVAVGVVLWANAKQKAAERTSGSRPPLER